MSKTAFVYFPFSVFPVQSGGQWRCASTMMALIAAGYEITLVTAGGISPEAKRMAASFGIHSWFSTPSLTLLDRAILKMRGYLRCMPKPIAPRNHSKLLKLLKKLGTEHGCFDLVLINYTNNYWVRQYLRGRKYLLETLDLISVSEKMISFGESHISLQGRRIVEYHPEFLRLDFFKNIPVKTTDTEAEECHNYDAVIMIAEKEANALKASAPHLEPVIIPPNAALVERTGSYAGPPVFASGPNIFNAQGLLVFQEKILPAILRMDPDFQLNVTGRLTYEVALHERVSYLGLVPDIFEVYQGSGFAVVPTFGGTGQQLKVVEAMGAGLAVVAFAQRVDTGIIEDGVDGFLAESEQDFAEKTLALWNNIELRQKMGNAAKAKIARHYSQESTNRSFKELISSLS